MVAARDPLADAGPARPDNIDGRSYRRRRRDNLDAGDRRADVAILGRAGVYFTGNFATQMLMVHQVAYLVDHGVPTMVAATSAAPSAWSASRQGGWGVLSDRAGRELACTLAFGCVAASIARWSWRAGIRRR